MVDKMLTTDSSELNTALFQIQSPIFVDQSPKGLSVTSYPPHKGGTFKLKNTAGHIQAFAPAVTPKMFGEPSFMKRHKLKYPYIAGAMANGISSQDLVTTMAKNGMAGFFGAGGLSIQQIEKQIIQLHLQGILPHRHRISDRLRVWIRLHAFPGL